MKRKLKIIQIIGIFIMSTIFIRAGLLNIIQVSDFHYLTFWNSLFVISVIFILLYPLYQIRMYLKSKGINSVIESINKSINNLINWINN